VLVGAKVKIKADVVGEHGFPKRGVEGDFPDKAVMVRVSSVMTLRGQMVRDVRQWVPVVQGVKVSGSLGVR
jgi:hypothetical protein